VNYVGRIETGAGSARTDRMFVVSQTYTLDAAAKRLELPGRAVADAVRNKTLAAFIDPNGKPGFR